MKIFAKIRFAYGALAIALPLALIMIPGIWLFPKKKALIMHKVNSWILFFLGAKLVKSGERDPDANLFLFNHQGIIDIISIVAIENTNFRWVAKRELFKMPIYGWLLRLGDMIPVDRNNKAGLLKLLKDIKESIEVKHRAVAIAPEGTRAKGQKLLPFKAGPNFVANKLGMRVQPIVITGGKWLLDEDNFTAHSSIVRLTYLPAFNANEAPKDWYEKVKTDMQAAIDDIYEKYGEER
jgi:1-acyl-sn-glycerol-3-phosphate acyltransferase